MSKCSTSCPPTCSFTIDYCNYPVFCDEYDCENPETCTVSIPSDCVVYNGTLLQQYGIENGDTVTQIIIKLAQLLYPDCFFPTTTTTTVPCICWTVTATSFCYAEWVNCDGTPGYHNNFGEEPTITVCAQEDTLSIVGLAPLCSSTSINNGPCTGPGDCTTTTSTTTTTTIPCDKPEVIDEYVIFNEISSDGGVTFTNFTSTETSACTAVTDYESLSYELEGFTIEAVSINIGETVYNPGLEDCTSPDDGYYIMLGITNFIIRIQSGVITEIITCTTTTTTTP